MDASRWIRSSPKSLVRVERLAEVFRGTFLDGLKTHAAKAELRFPGPLAPLGAPEGFSQLLDTLYAKDWVVYGKPPFADPETVLESLGRYVHRVAISNRRLLDGSDGRVRFSYRDRTNGDVPAVADLPAEELIRRFLLHVLPSGLQRIRHYGVLANRAKKKALPRCRELLGLSPTPAEPPTPTDRGALLARLGIEPTGCPRCHHPFLVRVKRLAPAPTAWDQRSLSRPPPDTS